MLAQAITLIGFSTWAMLLYAMLPKAFSLHLRQNRRGPQAIKQPVRMTWKAGALATASLLVMVLVRLSEN